MAGNIPAALKSADITRFAIRAAQLEKAKPVVAYWCNYWIVNQILSKGLHNADDESMTYTMTLMDRLEQTKAEHAENDAVIDDVAGQAYVEEFGLETFQRADNAVKANKASRQTADTFQAAATFLELSHIWGPLDPEIASKIKFAKYHALRIAKALKAGEDPNLSNPTPEPSPLQEQPPLDPNDPDVRAINGSGSSYQDHDGLRQPSVEEVPDDHDRMQLRLAQTSTLDQSMHPSREPSVPRPTAQHHDSAQPAPSLQEMDGDYYYHNAPVGGVSPMEMSATEKGASEEVEYFPKVPDKVNDARSPDLPEAPSVHPGSPPMMDLPDPSPLPPPSSSNDPFHQPSHQAHPGPDVSGQPLHIHQADIPEITQAPPRASYPSQPPSVPSFIPRAPPQTTQPVPPRTASQRMPAQPVAPQAVNNQLEFVADEEAVLKAQKHARWAISALNFEDVNTAVLELRGALKALGAT